MKRSALQNKQVGVYEWLFGPAKFSGLSRNDPLVSLLLVSKTLVPRMRKVSIEESLIPQANERKIKKLCIASDDIGSDKYIPYY